MRIFVFILFFISFLPGFSQKFISGVVKDCLDNSPLENVNITIENTNRGVSTDAEGRFKLEIKKFPLKLNISHLGYVNKTIEFNYQEKGIQIFLVPEVFELGTATVKPVINISKGLWLDIIDYEFYEGNILVSGFCYDYGKKQNPWIYQMSPGGDTLTRVVAGVPGKFFPDCMGNIQYLTESKCYELLFEGDSIYFVNPASIEDFYNYLEACVLETPMEYVFRYYAANDQIINYYAVNKDTKEWRIFYNVYDQTGLELMKYSNLFNSMGRQPTEVDARFEKMCFYDSVFAPMVQLRDSIFVFNFAKEEIQILDYDFVLQRTAPLKIHHNKEFEEVLIPDKTNGDAYALFSRKGLSYIRKINLSTGDAEGTWKIPEYKWISKIKIDNEILYFLYREKYSGDLVSLYKMKL